MLTLFYDVSLSNVACLRTWCTFGFVFGTHCRVLQHILTSYLMCWIGYYFCLSFFSTKDSSYNGKQNMIKILEISRPIMPHTICFYMYCWIFLSLHLIFSKDILFLSHNMLYKHNQPCINSLFVQEHFQIKLHYYMNQPKS